MGQDFKELVEKSLNELISEQNEDCYTWCSLSENIRTMIRQEMEGLKVRVVVGAEEESEEA